MNMKTPTSSLRLVALALCVLTSAPALAVWKWRDGHGVIQFTDRPPPATVAEKDILQRPAGARVAPQPQAVAAEGPASAASAALAPMVKASDPALEAKLREQEKSADAKKKALHEQAAKQRAENCTRAKGYEKTLSDGFRIARTNDKGEREIMDDAARAKEMTRTREVIGRECGQ